MLRELLTSGAYAAPVFGTLTHPFVMDVLKQGRRYTIALLTTEMMMRVQLVMATNDGWRVLRVQLAAMVVVIRRKEHGTAPIRIHVHHMVINVTTTAIYRLVRQNRSVVSSIAAAVARLSSVFPAAGARYGEVVDLARAVFASCQHVTHAGLVDIEPAQLRYLSLVLLAFVELDVLGCRFDPLLEGELLAHLRLLLQVVLGLPLLALRWLWLLDLTRA